MPAQTRSGRQPRVATPASAPPARVYKSSRPVQQQKFKPKSATVMRKYGRRSLPATLKQTTLTQIAWGTPIEQELIDLGDTDEEDKQDKPRKRRKTAGGTPSVPSSSFHTQTLTQLPWAASLKGEESEGLLIGDSEDEGLVDDEHGDAKVEGTPATPSRIIKTTIAPALQDSPRYGVNGPSPLMERSSNIKPPKDPYSFPSSEDPQTPALKRTTKFEIPSSNEASPLSPIKEPSMAQASQMVPTEPSVPKFPRGFVVQDSFATSTDGSSQLLNNTTPRALRSGRSQGSARRSGGSIRRSQRQPLAEIPVETPGSVRKSQRHASAEIPDSDDELLSLGPTPRKILETPTTMRIIAEVENEDADATGPGTPTPMTQKTITPSVKGSLPRLELPRTQPTKTVAFSSDALSSIPSPTIVQIPMTSEPVTGEQEHETPLSSPHNSVHDSTQDSPSPSTSPGRRSPAKTQLTQFNTQYWESQRLPLDIIHSLAPITDRSDIIISIHPEHVTAIAAGIKNYEFRSYRIPHTVSRFWIYTTRPAAEMRYMAVVSDAKSPGEIDSASGEGNKDFNDGKMSGKNGGFAYELIQVYQLNNPVSLEGMKANGWVEAPPQKYEYVPPAVVGQLLGNLRCALFVTGEDVSEDEAEMTISQELEEQIRADVEHTQVIASDAALIPSSQSSSEKRKAKPAEVSFALPTVPRSGRKIRPTAVEPSPATTASQPSSSQAQQLPSLRRSGRHVRPSQATTASQLSSQATHSGSSSPGGRAVPKRPTMGSSIPSVAEFTTQGGTTQGGGDTQLGLLGITSSQASLMGRMFNIEASGVDVISDSEVEDGD